MAAELLKQDPTLAALGGKKSTLRTMDLVLKAADQNVRKQIEEMLSSAIGGDVKNRARLSPLLTSCLVAGVPMTPERRQQALNWLQEDSTAGNETAIEQLMTLALLKEVEGGGDAAAGHFRRLPGKGLDTTSLEGIGQGLFDMQEIAAKIIINAAIQSYYTSLPRQSPDRLQPAVTYHFCNNMVAATAEQPRAVQQVALHANARVQQLPEPIWSCDMPEIKEKALAIRWGTDASSRPAHK